MHLIEQYALGCGVKIDKPSIEECFYPIPFNKYITLHASSGMAAKNYDYYSDVMRLLKPYLDKEGIEVIQIGAKSDNAVSYCHNYNGETTLKQTFYIIKNSLLHFGNDSFSTHVAAGYDIPLLSLYSVLYKECCGPYFGDKSKQITLEPKRKNGKCSFSDKENPKTVNKISPEKVARGVLNLLGIKHSLGEIKTIHMGSYYHTPIAEVIPNFIMDSSYMANSVMNIRMDLSFDERNLMHWSQNKKINIFTDKEIDPTYLMPIKDNIIGITYELNKDSNPEYISQLKSLGFNITLHTKDKNNLTDIRLKFLDWQVLYFEKKTKKTLDNPSEICNNSRYQSSKILLSNGQKYASKSAWIKDIPGVEKGAKIIDSPQFWEEQDYFKIYNGEKDDEE